MSAHPTALCPDGAPPPSGDDRVTPPIRTPADTMRELRRELERKRQFASDTAHELRTAITGLRTELDEARLYPDEIDLGDLLTRALRDVDRLDAIIGDLRVIAELDTSPPMPPQQVDLAELVHDEIVRRTDRIAVRLDLEPGATVQAVPIRIGRVLTNLLDNAQRHGRHLVEVRVSHDDDHVVLTVTDDGEGIAESERERVFQRFTRLKAARRLDPTGTGLGLAIARDIARSHLGTLHAGESGTGGASFVLRLPLAHGDRELRAAGRLGMSRKVSLSSTCARKN